jgi:hypothetical protein
MLKFKIIDLRKQIENTPSLQSDKINFLQEQDKVLEPQGATILIITDETEQNMIGKVYLIKRKLNHLEEDISRLIPTGPFYQDHVWECSILKSPCSQKRICCSPSTENFFRHFYHTLYEGIVAFGMKNGVGFVVVKLTAAAYVDTKSIGLWPYIIEFPTKEFSDDFFYGILPLRGCFYEKYKKIWEDSEEE